MGDAFQYNANSTQTRFPTMARPEAVLRATEDSFEAILDNTLTIYGGGQIGIANAITNTTIKGTFNSFRLGKPLVHDLTLQVNLVIVSGIVFESNIAVCLPQDEFEEPRITVQLDKGLLMQDEADEDGTEMEDGTASLETDSFKGATTAWGPI
ncbi:MAG: hypothetical protein ASARMPREDX12_007799 [Alectoria sarmentosa]|nr:MAG: hypothetical protein ASARMPREDX12_007799 [Alectoria sarmentosa]